MLQAAPSSGLHVATTIIQAVLVSLPFLLAAVRYLTDTEAWDEMVKESGFAVPAGIVFSYGAIYGAFALSIIYVINNTSGLGVPLGLLAVFPITLFSLLMQPMIRAPESEENQQWLVAFTFVLMIIILVFAVSRFQ